MNNVNLTKEEIAEIKNEERFRTKTTESLKRLLLDFDEHCKTSQGFRNDVTRLKVYTVIHSGILLCIIYTLIKAFIGKIIQ